MENAALILAATVWRLMSYVFRGGVILLSVFHGDGLPYQISLLLTITIFSLVLFFTLKISELNAVAEKAPRHLLITCDVLDNILWFMTLITLWIGLVNVILC